MARPTKLDLSVQEEIVKALRGGNYRETAARLGGIHPDTLYEWLKRGDSGEEPFSTFSDAVKNAEAEAERESIASVRAQTKDWQASAWFLERKMPKKWARRDPDHETKTKLLETELKKSRAEVETLRAKLDLLRQGVDVDGGALVVRLPESLRRDGE